MGLTNAERQKRYRLVHKVDDEQQPTFIKMRMTGPRCAEPITEPLQAMRELNPNLNAMLQSTEQMNKVLCESAKLPLKKRRKIASSAVAQHDMHLQRLKAFRSDAGYGYDPMTQAFAHQPPVSFDEPTIQPAEVEAEDESSLGSRAAMERVMAEIPKKFHGKVATLGRYLKANPDLIRVTPQGQPIVAGRQLPSANLIDIMRSLYIWPKSHSLPSGVKEVMEALRSAGAPSYLLSNTAVRTMYQRLHEAGEQPHAETQTEPELEMEEELEYGEKLPQTPEGKHSEAEEFTSALHSPFPPQRTVRKVVEHAPARPMKPETKKASGISMKPETSKPSGIPTKHASSKASSGIRGKQVSSEASTSQSGQGGKANVEHLSAKPIRVLHLPKKPIGVLHLRREASKDSVSQAGKGYKDNFEPVRDGVYLPGKPIRILRLY